MARSGGGSTSSILPCFQATTRAFKPYPSHFRWRSAGKSAPFNVYFAMLPSPDSGIQTISVTCVGGRPVRAHRSTFPARGYNQRHRDSSIPNYVELQSPGRAHNLVLRQPLPDRGHHKVTLPCPAGRRYLTFSPILPSLLQLPMGGVQITGEYEPCTSSHRAHPSQPSTP